MPPHPVDALVHTGPHYAPDATYGVVRGVGADDLAAAGVQILMTNALHLMMKPGLSTVRALGGAKRLLAWDRVLATDSGGFQALSLIRENSKYGRIEEDGLVFVPEGANKRVLLSPRKSIQNQLRLGPDLLFCLDDCTHSADSRAEQEKSVRRTLAWAQGCRHTFDELCNAKGLTQETRPRLFAIVQGGRDEALRRSCAQGLLEIGFDGYGFGGWPLDTDGNLLEDMLMLTRELIPDRFPMHALGVGHPASIVKCTQMGYALFDSALPTRDARRGRLYVMQTKHPDLSKPHREWLDICYLQDSRHMKMSQPLDPECQGVCCQRYSTSALHHLFRLEDPLFARLATIHNLSQMTRLCALLRIPTGVSVPS